MDNQTQYGVQVGRERERRRSRTKDTIKEQPKDRSQDERNKEYGDEDATTKTLSEKVEDEEEEIGILCKPSWRHILL